MRMFQIVVMLMWKVRKFFSFCWLKMRNPLVIDFLCFFFWLLVITDDGHSIYVRNLPFDSTPTQLEEVFKNFGVIKHEGIQVRSNKV